MLDWRKNDYIREERIRIMRTKKRTSHVKYTLRPPFFFTTSCSMPTKRDGAHSRVRALLFSKNASDQHYHHPQPPAPGPRSNGMPRQHHLLETTKRLLRQLSTSLISRSPTTTIPSGAPPFPFQTEVVFGEPNVVRPGPSSL